MNRLASMLSLIVLLAGTRGTLGAEPEMKDVKADPFVEVSSILRDATAKLSSIAVIQVESSGTTEDVSGVQVALIKTLARRSDLLTISPDEVIKMVGVEFETSPAALAMVAKKCSAQAVLYPQIIKSKEELDLVLVLIGDDAKVLLDRSFALTTLPSSREPVARPATAPKATPQPPPPPPGAPPKPLSQDMAAAEFARKALSLAMRDKIRPGHVIMYIGPFGVMEYEHPSYVIGEDWFILLGADKPINERMLATLLHRDDIIQRIDKRVFPLKVARNVGIGLTVGGFIATVIALPFVNSDNSNQSSIASAFAVSGVAAGLTGVLLWMIYGPQISAVESPFPPSHTISQDEARKMVNDYNNALLQKLEVPEPPLPKRSSYKPTWHFSIAPETHGGMSAAFGATF